MSPTLTVVGSGCLPGAANKPHHLSSRQVTPQPSFFYFKLLAETLQSEKEQDPFIFSCRVCATGLWRIVDGGDQPAGLLQAFGEVLLPPVGSGAPRLGPDTRLLTG